MRMMSPVDKMVHLSSFIDTYMIVDVRATYKAGRRVNEVRYTCVCGHDFSFSLRARVHRLIMNIESQIFPIMLAMMNGGSSSHPSGLSAELKKIACSLLMLLLIWGFQQMQNSRSVSEYASFVKKRVVRSSVARWLFPRRPVSKYCRRDIDATTLLRRGVCCAHTSPVEFVPVIKDINSRVLMDRPGIVVKDVIVRFGDTIPCAFHEGGDDDECDDLDNSRNGRSGCDLDLSQLGYPGLKVGVFHQQETIEEDSGGNGRSKGGCAFSLHTYTVTLLCDRYDTIQAYIKDCVKRFHVDSMRSTFEEPKMFLLERVRGPDLDDGDTQPLLDYVVLDHEYDETFANKFFNHKRELRALCHNFVASRRKHKELGIPHTLGVCLHGCPGSGKTSAIKAFCAERSAAMEGNPPVHIIVVNVSLVTNVNILRSVLMDDYLNGTYIPHDRRVYVLEEIDCSAWKEVIRSRVDKENGSASPPQPSQHRYDEKRDSGGGKNRKDDDDSEDTKEDRNAGKRKHTVCSSDFPLTLGQILETLDGMIKRNGHVIFLTTNHVQEIDDALLRPGRIDYVLDLGRLSKSDVRDMYVQWFDGDTMPVSVFRDMSDATFTQADVGCIFTHHREAVHRMLTTTEVSEEGKKTEKKRPTGPPSFCTSLVGVRSHPVEVYDECE